MNFTPRHFLAALSILGVCALPASADVSLRSGAFAEFYRHFTTSDNIGGVAVTTTVPDSNDYIANYSSGNFYGIACDDSSGNWMGTVGVQTYRDAVWNTYKTTYTFDMVPPYPASPYFQTYTADPTGTEFQAKIESVSSTHYAPRIITSGGTVYPPTRVDVNYGGTKITQMEVFITSTSGAATTPPGTFSHQFKGGLQKNWTTNAWTSLVSHYSWTRKDPNYNIYGDASGAISGSSLGYLKTYY